MTSPFSFDRLDQACSNRMAQSSPQGGLTSQRASGAEHDPVSVIAEVMCKVC